MNALVIFDSIFGNTERLARVIGDELRADVLPVADVTALPVDVDLVVLGGPTHAHGMSHEIKRYLSTLATGTLRDTAVAAFDTRVDWPALLSGSAARGIARELSRKGAYLVAEPESFVVGGREGPLLEGEVERAAEWARRLATGLSRVAGAGQMVAHVS